MDSRQQRKQDSQRRKLWRILAAFAVAGVLMLLGLEYWLRLVAEDADPRRAMRLMGVAMLALQMAFAVVAALLGRCLLDWARQTREQGQWPPAGLEWPTTAPARHGADAARIARRLRFTGIGLVVVALLLAAWAVLAAWPAAA